MSKNLNEIVSKMVKEHENKKVTFITEKLKIKGYYSDLNEKNPDCIVTVEDAEIYKLKEKCNSEECDYYPEPMSVFSVLNISSQYILGFGYCGSESDNAMYQE